jgi:hypothetical protein
VRRRARYGEAGVLVVKRVPTAVRIRALECLVGNEGTTAADSRASTNQKAGGRRVMHPIVMGPGFECTCGNLEAKKPPP